MIHKAWCSIEKVPYYFSRLYIKFQSHTGWKIDDLDQMWARLLGRSQLSNPSDLPCYFQKSRGYAIMLGFMDLMWPRVFQRSNVGLVIPRSPSAPMGIVVIPCFRPSVPLSVLNDITAVTLQGFQLSTWNLVGWCTVLDDEANCNLKWPYSTNFCTFHGTLKFSMIGPRDDLTTLTL